MQGQATIFVIALRMEWPIQIHQVPRERSTACDTTQISTTDLSFDRKQPVRSYLTYLVDASQMQACRIAVSIILPRIWIQYSTVQYSTVQYSTVLLHITAIRKDKPILQCISSLTKIIPSHLIALHTCEAVIHQTPMALAMQHCKILNILDTCSCQSSSFMHSCCTTAFSTAGSEVSYWNRWLEGIWTPWEAETAQYETHMRTINMIPGACNNYTVLSDFGWISCGTKG